MPVKKHSVEQIIAKLREGETLTGQGMSIPMAAKKVGVSYDPGDGVLRFGGWTWRYDLAPLGPSETEVWLSYDWSAAPEDVRQRIQFPPFAPDHLDNSLTRLAQLVVA